MSIASESWTGSLHYSVLKLSSMFTPAARHLHLVYIYRHIANMIYVHRQRFISKANPFRLPFLSDSFQAKEITEDVHIQWRRKPN